MRPNFNRNKLNLSNTGHKSKEINGKLNALKATSPQNFQ